MNDSPAPVLEMLWEADDPGQALDGRFGFSQAQAAGRWVADTLDERWGVRVEDCERIVMSGGNALAWVRTPSGRLLAKWSVVPARFPRLAEVARLISWLDGRGLPVSAPVPARDGRLQAEFDGVSMGLQRVIDGDLLDTADPAQVRATGAMLARLQDALAAYPYAASFPVPAVACEPLTRRVTGWLDARAGHLPTRSPRSSTSRRPSTTTGSSSWPARRPRSVPGTTTGGRYRPRSARSSSPGTRPCAG